MPTDAQAVEPELHPRPAQSQTIIDPPDPPANLLGFLSFLVFGSPRDLTRIYGPGARVWRRGSYGGWSLAVLQSVPFFSIIILFRKASGCTWANG